MSRSQRIAIAEETLSILGSRGYFAPSGREVDLGRSLEEAVQRTRLYRPRDLPGESIPPADAVRAGSTIEVTGETTLEAGRRLTAACGVTPLCLNFASARNPGGGFLNGSRAQEESLARSSGLYA